MTDDTPADGTEALPDEITERLGELSQTQLRELVHRARQQVSERHESAIDQIEAGEGEKIVRKTEQNGYVEVVKSQSCNEGCSDCPHGPYLYHVSQERRMDGETKLNWKYVGRVSE